MGISINIDTADRISTEDLIDMESYEPRLDVTVCADCGRLADYEFEACGCCQDCGCGKEIPQTIYLARRRRARLAGQRFVERLLLAAEAVMDLAAEAGLCAECGTAPAVDGVRCGCCVGKR